MTTMSVVGECFFWYRLTRVVPDNFHRAVKRLCVCVDLPAGVTSSQFSRYVATHRDVQTAADITEVSGDANGSEMDQEAD